MHALRFALLSLCMAALVQVGAAPCRAGSKVYVGRSVAAARQVSMDRIDHGTWHGLLQKYVDAAGNVDYTAWKRSSRDVAQLDAYLNHLSTASLSTRARREARLAFWINAYNAVTVRGILREYPTSSIRNHTARLFGYNIWHDLLLSVGGQAHSLDQIEHQVLRKMREPRIHFAIVCASRSCPRLLNEAYTAQELEAQLAANAREFFASSANFRHDTRNRRFYLSTILDWFGEDFGSSQAAQLKAIAPYLPTPAARRAASANAVSVSYLEYDWGLNDQKTARAARR